MELFDYLLAVKNAGGGGGGTGTEIDWSQIGYSDEPDLFSSAFDHAKTLYNAWDSTKTSYANEFKDDLSLVICPSVDTSLGTDFSSMFNGCSHLYILPDELDTSNGTTFSSMFSGCANLTDIPELDLSKATNIGSIVSGCTNLTNLGGFKNLGQAYSTSRAENYTNYKLNFSSSNLTHDSLMNIINNLYDIKTKGCNNQAVTFGATNLARLSAEEIAIGTDKGWNIS